jgi:hypothetical protein
MGVEADESLGSDLSLLRGRRGRDIHSGGVAPGACHLDVIPHESDAFVRLASLEGDVERRGDL